MTEDNTPMRAPWGDVALKLTEITDAVLFDDVWRRPGLSPRDRSLVTVACLVALYRTNELPFHLRFALQNGVTRDELVEAITHLAFYAGWPAASTAVGVARKVFAENPNRPLARDWLLETTSHREMEAFDRAIDIRILRIRRKIELDPARPTSIRTVRGAGYMFVPPDD